MKNILLASTAALLVTAGYAAAEVTVTGDGRMGVREGFDFSDNGTDDDDVSFESRIRIRFAASGETDGGLQFGGSVRVDNYENDQATIGTEGNVFISGAFGKLTMGDVSGAAESAVGDVSGVGLTGLGDYNEFAYLSNSGQDDREAATYEYTTGDLTFYASADNPGGQAGTNDPDDDQSYSIAAKYTMNTYTFALGYEQGETDDAGPSSDVSHLIGGVTAGFGDITLKAIYGSANFDDDVAYTDLKQWGVSADYVMNATTLTAFYRQEDFDGTDAGDMTAYGLGASYDLGGGASLKGGIVKVDESFADDDTGFDFGISMTF